MSDRSPAEIRASIEQHRTELGVSLDRLRGQVERVTDWRSQLERNRTKVLVGAAVAGFVIGGGIAAFSGVMRRRR